MLGLVVANFGQVASEPARTGPQWTAGMKGRVAVNTIAVHDAPRETAYELGRLEPGDGARIRGVVRGGWLAIEPPSWAICWVERTSVELGEEGFGSRDHRREPHGSPLTAWVKDAGAVVRSGNPRAGLPGPPRMRLAGGTMVRLVDRPPVAMGGAIGGRWYAVAPPDDLVCFIRADGLIPLAEGTASVAARTPETVQVVFRPGDEKPTAAARSLLDPPGLPREVSAELAGIDAAHRAVVSRRRVADWRFEAERARTQAILKRSGDDPRVGEAVSARLKRLDRDEQTAAAARDFEKALARMRALDAEVAAAEKRLAGTSSPRAGGYAATGFMKPSNQFVDGRKLYALLGDDGKTLAFLDVPPGLEIEPMTTVKVGVRGRAHFDQDLGAPLITVRELEPVVRGR